MRKRRFFIGSVGLCVLVTTAVCAAGPGQPYWWPELGATNTNLISDDFSLINQGQLKNLALATYLQFEMRMNGGAGRALAALMSNWIQTDPSSGGFLVSNGSYIPVQNAIADPYAVVNIGQLKNVAAPFYDQVNQALSTYNILPIPYPWTTSSTPPDDFAVATIGQAKALFAFSASTQDTDGDGIPDVYEVINGMNPTDPSDAGSATQDGTTNLEDFLTGTDPLGPIGASPGTPPDPPLTVVLVTNPDGSSDVLWISAGDTQTYFAIRTTSSDGTSVEIGRVGPTQRSFHIAAP